MEQSAPIAVAERRAGVAGTPVFWREASTAGGRPPTLYLHGVPTNSDDWVPFLKLTGGVAVDLPGMGRSGKPAGFDYSIVGYQQFLRAFVEHLELERFSMVVHDWGGAIGLRLAVEHPDRVARMVVLDTGLFTGHQRMTEAWRRFRDFVERTEDLPVGFLVGSACARGLSDEDFAAYEAPFDSPASKAGARAFPLILPTTPDAPGAAAGARVLDALREDARPKLMLWADSDPILPLESVGVRFAAALGQPAPEVVFNASHFLQEDAGEEIGQRIAEWLVTSARAPSG